MAKIKSKDAELEITAKLSGAENMQDWCREKSRGMNSNHGTSGALYFVGFIGALVYWLQVAVGFGAVLTAFLKAMVWPAYVVYKLLEGFYGVAL